MVKRSRKKKKVFRAGKSKTQGPRKAAAESMARKKVAGGRGVVVEVDFR